MTENLDIQEAIKKQREQFFKDFYEKKQRDQGVPVWKKVFRGMKEEIKKITFKNLFHIGNIFNVKQNGSYVNIFQTVREEQRKAASLALINNPIVIKKQEQDFKSWKTYLPAKQKKFKPFPLLTRKIGRRA